MKPKVTENDQKRHSKETESFGQKPKVTETAISCRSLSIYILYSPEVLHIIRKYSKAGFYRLSLRGGRNGLSFTHLAIHSMPSVTPAPVRPEQGRIMQSREPILFEQSWNACLISRIGRHPEMSCLLPRIRSGALSRVEKLKQD